MSMFGKGGNLGGALKGGAVGGALGGTMGAGVGTYAGSIGVDKFGKQIFGSDTDAGVLGTGQFKGQGQGIDEAAFRNQDALKQRQAEFQKQLAATQNRNVGQINAAPQDQFRNAQLGLMSQLQAQSAGQGPSLAQMQLQQGADRNLANAIAMQASQRGGASGGLAMRNIANQRASIGQDLAAQSGMQRLQEQQQAQAALGQLSGSARGQDIGLAQAQSQAALQAANLNDQMARFYNTGLADLDMAQTQSLQDLEKLKVNQNLGVQGLNASAYEGASKRRGDFIGGIGQGIAAAFSDKRLKKNIKDDEDELSGFLAGLNGRYEGGVIGRYDKKDKGPDETEEKAKKLMSGKGSEGDSGHTKSGKALGYGVGSAFGEDEADDDMAMGVAAEGADYDAKSVPVEMFANKGGVVCKEKGGLVPGRAKVAGDSPKNDTVLAKLSPGEGVIKRTDMQDLGINSDEKLQEFIDGLKAYTYNYKNSKHGEGKFASPMAQDLEKSELGKSMVIDKPEGKMVDYSRAAGTMLATAAMLNNKMKNLEEKVGGYAAGGVVDDQRSKLAMSMKSAFKTPDSQEEEPESSEKSLWGSDWYTDKIKKATPKGYASGGMVEDDDKLSRSMKLAFNALERRPEPNSRPDYNLTENDKKFAESMRKAFRGK